MLVTQVKNIEFQCHVAECELHDSISEIDYRIGSGQKWCYQNNWHMPKFNLDGFIVLKNILRPSGYPNVFGSIIGA